MPKYQSHFAVFSQLRHTHVQDGEAGGITQQIGATNVPLEAINEQTKMIKNVSYLICYLFCWHKKHLSLQKAIISEHGPGTQIDPLEASNNSQFSRLFKDKNQKPLRPQCAFRCLISFSKSKYKQWLWTINFKLHLVKYNFYSSQNIIIYISPLLIGEERRAY